MIGDLRTRPEFTRAIRELIRIFGRTADTHTRKVLDRMDAELRFGDARVFEHLFARYVQWHPRQRLDSVAVRLTYGEFFADVAFALSNGMAVVDAIESNRGRRLAS